MNKIALLNILSTVLLNGISLFTAPVFSRMLGAENYGIVSIYLTWVSLLSVSFSLQTDATLVIAKSEYSAEEHKKYQSSVLMLSLTGFLLGGTIMLVFIKPLASLLHLDQMMIPMMLVQAYGMFCVAFVNERNTFDFRADRNLVFSIVVSALTISLSMLFMLRIPQKENYWGRIAALTLSYGTVAAVVSISTFRRGKVWYSKRYWKFCLPLSTPLILHSLAITVLGQSDRVMLQWMESNTMVGIYSLTASFSSILSTIWAALNNSWCPFFYDFARKKEIWEIKAHGKNYLELYSVLTIGFILLAPEVFRIFASEEYWHGTKLIPLFSVGYYMVFLYSFPVNYELFNKNTKFTAMGTIFAALCNIVLNYFFISYVGIAGAALATMIAHGLQFLFHQVCAKQINGSFAYPFPLRILLPYTVIVCCCAFGVTVLQEHWVLRWGIGTVLGCHELSRIVKRRSIF